MKQCLSRKKLSAGTHRNCSYKDRHHLHFLTQFVHTRNFKNIMHKIILKYLDLRKTENKIETQEFANNSKFSGLGWPRLGLYGR